MRSIIETSARTCSRENSDNIQDTLTSYTRQNRHCTSKNPVCHAPSCNVSDRHISTQQQVCYCSASVTHKVAEPYSMNSTKPPQTPATPCFPEPGSPSSTALAQVDSNPASSISAKLATLSRHVSARRHGSVLTRRFAHMLRPLAPLLSIETGLAHPRFPRTLLHYYLLTSAELEELAHFYHQRTPSTFSMQYPMPVVSRWHAPAETNEVDTETMELSDILGMPMDEQHFEKLCQLKSKRYRFGRFMGLQGMESGTGEGNMREEMERWVASEMARRERRNLELESWRSKGYW